MADSKSKPAKGQEKSKDRKANRRGAARLAAVQALYQMDIAGAGINDIFAEFESHWLGNEVEGEKYLPAEAAFFRDVVSGVVRDQTKLDPLIDDALSKGWPLKRIDAILRAVLRAGAYELEHRKDVPGRVVISEYVDVAHAFVDGDETGMVNAVLDQIARQFRADEFSRASGQQSGEDSLIARYFKPIATDPGALGLDDDAAALKARGEDIVVTTDAIVEGVHFLPDDPPDTIARKALRVNLSDIAAKGATPAGFVLTLALRGVDEGLARGVCARAGRGRQSARLSAARRRHGVDAGAADGFDHRVWPCAGGQDGPSQRRQGGRPRDGDGHDRRCRARPRYPHGRSGRRGADR